MAEVLPIVKNYPPFEYTPLDPTRSEIRLVILHSREFSRSLGREEQLLCDVQLFPLDPSPRNYNALSYTWGTGASSRVIWLNNQTFAIHDNLYMALQNLRHESIELIIWIDAICINQADNIEKAHQVQLMRQVYERALWTVVWLGEATDDSDIAFDCIYNLGKGITEMTHTSWKEMESKINTSNDAEATFPLKALFSLIERPWWSRMRKCFTAF